LPPPSGGGLVPGLRQSVHISFEVSLATYTVALAPQASGVAVCVGVGVGRGGRVTVVVIKVLPVEQAT
jgi:hypothetical protein